MVFGNDVKETKRGEVYYITSGESYYSVKTGRPAVIVSSKIGLENNKKTVMVLFLTTNLERSAAHYVKVTTTSRTSLVNCSEVFTVDRRDVGDYMCTLNEYELKQVDEKLSFCLGLPAPYGEEDDEITEEIEEEDYDCETDEDERASIVVERDMYKKLYDKAMEQLIELKFSKDLTPPAPVEETNEDEEEPYTPPAPVEETNLANVNTDHAKVIAEKTGLPIAVAYGITGYRKKIGVYLTLDDLLQAPRFTEYHLKKYGKRLTV